MASVKKEGGPLLATLVKNDKGPTVKAAAIDRLAEYGKKEYTDLFLAAVNDSSYTVAGNALNALISVDPEAGAPIVKKFAGTPMKGVLQSVVMNEILKSGDESMADKIIGDFAAMPLSQGKFEALNGLSTYLSAIKNIEKIKWGVDEVVKFREKVPENFRNQTDPFINGMVMKGILAAKGKQLKETPDDKALAELVEYIKAKLPEGDKKGF